VDHRRRLADHKGFATFQKVGHDFDEPLERSFLMHPACEALSRPPADRHRSVGAPGFYGEQEPKEDSAVSDVNILNIGFTPPLDVSR
jgi:hypothetical protein